METRNPDLTKKLINALAAVNFPDIQKAYNEGARFNHIPMDEHPFREFKTKKRMDFFEMVADSFSEEMRKDLFSWLIQRSREKAISDEDLCIPEPHLRAMNNQEWDPNSQLKDRFRRTPISYYFAYGHRHDPDKIAKFKSIQLTASLIEDGYDDKRRLLPGFKIYLENCTDHDIDLNEMHQGIDESLARWLLFNEAYEALLNLVRIKLRKDVQQGRHIIELNHIMSRKLETPDKTITRYYLYLNSWLNNIEYNRLPIHEEIFSYCKLIDLYLGKPSSPQNPVNMVILENRLDWLDLLISHSTGVNFNIAALKKVPGQSATPGIYSLAAWLVNNGCADILVKYLDKATVPIDLTTPFSLHTSRNLRDVIHMKGNPDGLLEKIEARNRSLRIMSFPSSLPVLPRPAPSAVITREPVHEPSSSASSATPADNVRKSVRRKKRKPVIKPVTVDTAPTGTEKPDQPPSVNYEEIIRSLKNAFSFIRDVDISHEDDKFIITFPETGTVSDPDNDDNLIPFAPVDVADILSRIRKILLKHCKVNEDRDSNQLILAGKDISFNNDFDKSMRQLHVNIYDLLQNAGKKSKAEPSPPVAPCSTGSSSPESRRATAELPDTFRRIAGLQSSFCFLLNGRTINNGKDYCIEFSHERADSYDELLRIISTIADVINARLPDTISIAHEQPKMKMTIRVSALEELISLKNSDMAGLQRDYDVRMAVPADPDKGLNTSDHTYRSAFFHLCSANGQILRTYRGFTWNLLNRCVEGNNAWQRNETVTLYLDRKEKQLDKIRRLIEKSKPDFFFLQEVDIFSLVPPNFITPEHTARYSEIKRRFYEFLRDRMIIRRQEYFPGVKRKALVTFYNPNTYDFVSENTQFDGAGFECHFKCRTSNTYLVLLNLHLYYDQNANDRITAYLKQLGVLGRVAFIGGDSNSADHPDIYVNPHCVTNIAATAVYQNRRPVYKITDKDEKGRSKAYDGFGASVGSNQSVIIGEEEGEVFLFDERTQEFKVAVINPQARYPSSYIHEVRPLPNQQTTPGVQLYQSPQRRHSPDTPVSVALNVPYPPGLGLSSGK